jgi:hypothetical protein
MSYDRGLRIENEILLTAGSTNLFTLRMSRLVVGLLCGLIFGAVDVALMLPMSFPDKRTALLAAFLSRFGIGFVIPLINLPAWPGWLIGVVIGVLLSLPDAVVTKTYGPILLSGAVGGLIIGGITHGWAMR